MPVLNLLSKLTKKQTAETETQGVVMAESDKRKESAAKKQERVAARAQKRQDRESRQAARKSQPGDKVKPERLCTLETVEVRKSSEGFQVGINGAGGRKTITIAPNEASQVLRDLETAIQVIRSRQ